MMQSRRNWSSYCSISYSEQTHRAPRGRSLTSCYGISARCSRVVLRPLYGERCRPASRTGNGIIPPLAWHFINLKCELWVVLVVRSCDWSQLSWVSAVLQDCKTDSSLLPRTSAHRTSAQATEAGNTCTTLFTPMVLDAAHSNCLK